MTESVYGMNQDQVSESQPVTSSGATETSSSQAPAERLFKQSEVNEIVKRAKSDAVRVANERPDYVQQKYQQQDDGYFSRPNREAERTNDYAHDSDIVRQIAAEEAQRLRNEWLEQANRTSQEQQAQRIVHEFVTKMAAGKDKYDDFDQVTGDVDFGKFPNVVQLVTGYVDNPEDVMYALGADRIKMANLEQLSRMSPSDGINAIKRLSKSLRDNEAASKIRMPNEPLSQLRPSNAGTDTGRLEVKDLRSKYRA